MAWIQRPVWDTGQYVTSFISSPAIKSPFILLVHPPTFFYFPLRIEQASYFISIALCLMCDPIGSYECRARPHTSVRSVEAFQLYIRARKSYKLVGAVAFQISSSPRSPRLMDRRKNERTCHLTVTALLRGGSSLSVHAGSRNHGQVFSPVLSTRSD